MESDTNAKESSTDIAVDSGAASPEVQAGTMEALVGYKPQLKRNRSMFTLLFMSLAIAAIPYGEGAPLISAIYGGGQSSIVWGWTLVLLLDQCIALSLSELASAFPTSAGPSYWAFQLAATKHRTTVAYLTGWMYVIGNWTITLSVNFGFASLVAGTVAIYQPDYSMPDWVLLLIFYGLCLASLVVCMFCNDWLPMVDILCAGFTLAAIIIICITLSVTASNGRASAAFALGNFDSSLSGWGDFTFFIGMLPAAYTFSAIGMIASMAEECTDANIKVPRALSLAIPVGGVAGYFFIIPICVTMPALADIITAPGGQALPYIFASVTASDIGGMVLTLLVIIISVFCSVSITCAASRTTWAFARDDAMPGFKLLAKVHPTLGVPTWSIVFVTLVQLLLGLINFGSSSAFTAFVSVGVQALALSYAIPILLNMLDRRQGITHAAWKLKTALGWLTNTVAVLWIGFELVLFSMPTVLPATAASMNYASVVLVGMGTLAAVWYAVHSRKSYRGPPLFDHR